MFPNLSEIEDFRAKAFFEREIKVIHVFREVNYEVQDIVNFNPKRNDAVMINKQTQESLKRVGQFLLDISKLKGAITLPSNGEELQSLTKQVIKASVTGDPIPLFTPFCPDWSRDKNGRYDFKSLGGDLSYIAKKVFRYSQPLLKAFVDNDIPYRGVLIFANWGLETEIDAKDSYGQKLSQDDIQMCFESTLARTDEELRRLQTDTETGKLFRDYKVVKMTDFFKDVKLDPEATYAEADLFFRQNNVGRRLAEVLHVGTVDANKLRFGTGEEENKNLAIQNLAEYAVLGQAFGRDGIIMPAESQTATRAYNVFRKKKLPVFSLKGKEGDGANLG